MLIEAESSIINFVLAFNSPQPQLSMLLTPLRQSHGERISIFTDLCVSHQALLKFFHVFLETSWRHFVGEYCLSFLWCF